MDGKYMIIAICIIVFILIALLIGIIIRDGNRFVVDNYSFTSPKVSKETKFVFLSDLHNKFFDRENTSLLETIKNLSPDFILVGGDMIVAKPGLTTKKTADFVGRLTDIAPVVYGMGNHEYRSMIYPEVYGDMYSIYRDELATYNIDILDNKFVDFDNFRIYSVSIEPQFYIRLFTPKMPDGYIKSLIGEIDDSKINILLAHNPDYFNAYSEYGADLSLSGHVHGGVIRLPLVGGLLSPKIRFFPKYNGGLYKKNGKSMIVSRGLGVHTIPIRVFNPSEVSFITFKPD